MKLNELYHGFKLIDLHDVEEVKSTAHIFEHEKTGARLLYLKNDDPDKVFSVAFRTPPSDSTGVPHIVEHCVLSGSRRYKTKEPFMDMVKGSLKTFINAMTFSDKTIYPVASKNHKDFENLMDVYLDAVFFPMIHEDDTIFMQEGWHYSLADKADPIKYNGVVYNEMRGAYSQPMSYLREYIGGALFPDTTYRFSSGGNPDHIYELTIEDFKGFHKTYYQPSNAYFYLYGDGDVDSHMKKINEEYLDHFGHVTVDSDIPLQTGFTGPVDVQKTYAISESEEIENKTFLSMNYVLGEGKNLETQLSGQVLKEILVAAEGAPLKEALLNKGIGQDILCSVGGGRQIYLSIIAKNANGDQEADFKATIHQTLKQMIADKIDEDLLASALNVVEYDLRDTGFPTKGINYHISSLESWLYDGHATEALQYNSTLTSLREKMSQGYYEGLLDKLLLNNPHSACVTLSPEKGLNERKAEKLVDHLKTFKASLSDNEIDEIIKANEVLKKKQLTPDSEEARNTMPKIKVKDVNPQAEVIPTQVEDKGHYMWIQHELFTNDIMYLEMMFDTRSVDQDKIQYLPLLAELLGKMNLDNMGYAQLNNTIYKETGGIHFTTRNYTYTDGSGYEPKLILTGKVVKSKIATLMELSHTLLTKAVFDDEKRLKDLLQQHLSRLTMAIDNRGDQFASSRVSSYFAESSYYAELTKGFEYFWFISDLVKNFDDKKADVVKILTDLYARVFNQHNMIVSITGDQAICQEAKENLPNLLAGIRNEAFQAQSYKFDLEARNEGIYSASNVQYVAKGFDFKALGQAYKGSMEVLRSILNTDYLHDRIRAKNGAYGCGISFSTTGHAITTSFRDPMLKETIDIMAAIGSYLEDLDLSEDSLEQHIIGAISRMDGALTPKGLGVQGTSEIICKRSYEQKQKHRTELLSTTKEDILGFANFLKEGLKLECHCVYGNEKTVQAAKDVFKSIQALEIK